MNLMPYVHAVVKACVILPEDVAYRILELASQFEANLSPNGDACDWESFDLMEAIVERLLPENKEFQTALDKAATGMFANESYLYK